MTECCCRLTIWFSFSSPGRKLIFNNFLRVPLLRAPTDDIFARHTWQKWEHYRNSIWKANFLLARIFFYDFPVIRRAAENIKQFELIFLTPSHEWREREIFYDFSRLAKDNFWMSCHWNLKQTDCPPPQITFWAGNVVKILFFTNERMLLLCKNSNVNVFSGKNRKI